MKRSETVRKKGGPYRKPPNLRAAFTPAPSRVQPKRGVNQGDPEATGGALGVRAIYDINGRRQHVVAAVGFEPTPPKRLVSIPGGGLDLGVQNQDRARGAFQLPRACWPASLRAGQTCPWSPWNLPVFGRVGAVAGVMPWHGICAIHCVEPTCPSPSKPPGTESTSCGPDLP